MHDSKESGCITACVDDTCISSTDRQNERLEERVSETHSFCWRSKQNFTVETLRRCEKSAWQTFLNHCWGEVKIKAPTQTPHGRLHLNFGMKSVEQTPNKKHSPQKGDALNNLSWTQFIFKTVLVPFCLLSFLYFYFWAVCLSQFSFRPDGFCCSFLQLFLVSVLCLVSCLMDLIILRLFSLSIKRNCVYVFILFYFTLLYSLNIWIRT